MRVAGLEFGLSEGLALAALLVSGLSYWANRSMAAANKRMAASNETMAEANKRMAASAEVAAQAARESVELELTAVREERAARVVHRMGETTGSAIPVDRLGNFSRLGARIANEGPSLARDVELHITFPDGSTRSSGTRTSLEPNVEYSPKVEIYPFDLGPETTRTFPFKVSYRDGNGPQEFGFKIRLEGTWEGGQWQTFKEPL
jgi:hypothetical protein